ncbi:hypothetical protein QJS04_geneDACA020295 [Acorus gramineus]|uniref:Uncharacterized protein n=1 Tax=Acorus gramineus TaxID=55184 RepID=A0AAV9AB47_ACOGR|nr:hypothetical protein QJS04_geneDACA020295 [Acorus gramineus]
MRRDKGFIRAIIRSFNDKPSSFPTILPNNDLGPIQTHEFGLGQDPNIDLYHHHHENEGDPDNKLVLGPNHDHADPLTPSHQLVLSENYEFGDHLVLTVTIDPIQTLAIQQTLHEVKAGVNLNTDNRRPGSDRMHAEGFARGQPVAYNVVRRHSHYLPDYEDDSDDEGGELLTEAISAAVKVESQLERSRVHVMSKGIP